MAGVTVELLDDAGEVIATTVTSDRGRYSFDTFHETGDYQVRIVIPNRLRATTATARDVLISRGDLMVSGVNFGLRTIGRANSTNPPAGSTNPPNQQLAAVDAALAANQLLDPLAGLSDSDVARARRARPR